LRGTAAEVAVTGQAADGITAEEVGRLTMGGLSDIPSDLQGSANYRSRVGATMVARAWAAAVREAATSGAEAVHA
jgi:aerobic carbon-monoxide dehydrogenase medium subunit